MKEMEKEGRRTKERFAESSVEGGREVSVGVESGKEGEIDGVLGLVLLEQPTGIWRMRKTVNKVKERN